MGAPEPRAPSTPILGAGTVLGDRYQLVEPCGAGAMGSVWRARHVELGTSVAIKFLHPEIADTKDGLTRFEREARLAARLAEKCRYIAKVIDYGVAPELGPYLAMEMLEGEELADRLKREKQIPLAVVAVIVQQLCRALEVSHKAGIVHRDVKPQNVFLARPHTNMTVFVKLMDFGVAKLMEAEGSQEGLTRVGTVVGTPAYMSPEQLLAQRVDARSDLWSVAALVYRIVTGDLPFGSGTLQEMSVRIVTLDPKPPSEIVPGLPRAFDAWIAKGLAKSADDRFQTAQELSDALMEVAGSEEMPFALHPSPPPDSGMRLADLELEPITKREARPALERTESGVRRVRSPVRAMSVLALLVVGALAATALIPGPAAKLRVDTTMSAIPVEPEVSSAPPPVPSPSPSPPPPPEPPKRLKSKYKLK
jgi:serine/threonine-protein kinase